MPSSTYSRSDVGPPLLTSCRLRVHHHCHHHTPSAYLCGGSLPLLPQPRTSSASDPQQTVPGNPHPELRTADRNHEPSQHLATTGLHTDTPHRKYFRCRTKTLWTPELMRSWHKTASVLQRLMGNVVSSPASAQSRAQSPPWRALI